MKMDGALVLVGMCMGKCMVKGVWLSCLLQSALGRFLSESKSLLDLQASGHGPLSILQPKMLHVLC